ncbi:MAG: MMPL family transporter [Gammaproteobacteria bacterium]|nr:MMPL family transporter [Gammaproteobacteria bacterium]
MKNWPKLVTRFPKLIILLTVVITVFLALQLQNLRWETDARVYLPKGHPAIHYDEKVADLFGVKDSLIIGIVNDEKGVFNPETLAVIKRITDKITTLPGVIANRPVDVASLSTATVFTGDEESIGSVPLMTGVPQDPAAIEQLRSMVYANADLFVGNIVSADGKAAMIRARLKEGAANRYMSYWQIKGIIDAEQGGGQGGGAWGSGGDWSGNQQWGGSSAGGSGGNWSSGGGQWSPEQQAQWQQPKSSDAPAADNGDRFYLGGRPVIEVTSGLHAMEDMRLMIPLLLLALAVSLFLVFRTARGVFLPLFVMAAATIWTLGISALLDVPLYTISTMLPVILIAVSIGDAVHLMSQYYDEVVQDAHRSSHDIVIAVLQRMGAPLLLTSVTTAVGFLSLALADMPPFIVFGLFTVLGIGISWLLTVTFIPAVLTVMKPKVGNYLAKRRALRVHSEQDRLTKFLVAGAGLLYRRRVPAVIVLLALTAAAGLGATRMYVDSSWMSDFRKDSDLVKANDVFNEKFDGTIFLNMVLEGNHKDTFKDPDLLRRVETVQDFGETLPLVGGARSIVDYIKNMNKTLHAGDPAFNVLPTTASQIGEYLFLFSVSGRPEQLDEVIDYDYQRALVTFAIKTDHTRDLQRIINSIRQLAEQQLAGTGVEVNFAGSANNSDIWAQLLISSQTTSILWSKVIILVIAALLFRSFLTGLYTVIPVSLTTLFIAGAAGWAGIPLDVSTALAAGVAVGVGVDYAVHFIFRHRYESRLGNGDTLAVTQATMRSIGRTIVFNAAIVSVGFAMLFFSRFPPHVKLGYFVVAYMLLSCVMALVTLPLMHYFRQQRALKAQQARDEE